MAETIVVFLIVAFSFALVLIMKRDALPDNMRRPLAAMAVVMVAAAFVFMICSFFL